MRNWTSGWCVWLSPMACFTRASAYIIAVWEHKAFTIHLQTFQQALLKLLKTHSAPVCKFERMARGGNLKVPKKGRRIRERESLHLFSISTRFHILILSTWLCWLLSRVNKPIQQECCMLIFGPSYASGNTICCFSPFKSQQQITSFREMRNQLVTLWNLFWIRTFFFSLWLQHAPLT